MPIDRPSPRWTRRAFLGTTVPLLAACTSPLPLTLPTATSPSTDPVADALLRQSAEVHGLAAYRALHDINVAYAGAWRPLIGRIQPDVVDPTYRGASEERLLPREGLFAQVYRGSAGEKKVLWQRATGTSGPAPRIAVWRNGEAVDDEPSLGAAALVAESYTLFLLGPLWAVERGGMARLAGVEQVDGRACDVVEVAAAPGLGRSALDRVALCIDRADRVTRRVRFTLEGTANTQGAVAETDTFDHARRFGVLWPMRSHERVVHPFRLPAHDWHIAGLDVDRGYTAKDLAGPTLGGLASAPATPC